MFALRWLVGWTGAVVLVMWRLTCRYRVEHDPRPALRQARRPYVYALLHAHQIAALLVNDERRMAAMVSRSHDGDLLAPLLRIRRVVPVRGSSRKRGKDKGGRAALDVLCSLARQRIPVLLAVDGPQGPRNHVQRGVVDLARRTAAAILPVMVLPSRRWIVSAAWDRFQVPLPFCRLRLVFCDPIEPDEHPDDEALRALVETRLAAFEAREDPAEALAALRHPG